MQVKEQKLRLPEHELKFDVISAQQLIGFLRIQDEKLQRMLLWCSIVVLIGYASVILTILNCYSSIPGHHTGYLGIVLFLIYFLFGAFLWVQYRISTYQPTATQIRLKEFCRFKIQITKRQIRMLIGYLVAYALFVFASCLACWLEADDAEGADKIFKITAPISILVYVTGLYLLARLGVRWRALTADIRDIDREIIQGISQQ